MSNLNRLIRQPSDRNEIRVLVMIARHIEPELSTRVIQTLAPSSHCDVVASDPELHSYILSVIEMSKPEFNYNYDEYSLDHAPVIMTFADLDTFKSQRMLAKLSHGDALKASYRLTELDEFQFELLGKKYLEIYQSLTNHDETLEYTSDRDRSWSHSQIIEARDQQLKALEVVKAASGALMAQIDLNND